MSGRLEGLTVFVTAAGAGMGLAAARACWREGATVWATDRSPAKMPDWPADPRWIVRKLDVTEDAAVRAVVTEAGPIDVLFSNAGWVPHGTILDATDEDWERAFEVNVRSMFVLIRAALPGMIERGGGRIITMASVISSIKGTRNRAVYGATKAAVIGLTKSLGKELATTNVRVNCITPAVIETEILEQATPETRAYMVSRIPMGRPGKSEEVAALVNWLASDDCSFSTGAVFDISGGRATY
jgi:2-keto-3-deoxy-L-fuconate dehydrogenase